MATIDWDAFDRKIASNKKVSPTQTIQPATQVQEIPVKEKLLNALEAGIPPINLIRDPMSLVRTVPETLGGMSPKQKLMQKYEQKPGGENFLPAFARSLAVQTAGEVGNMATSPLSHVLPSATELALMSKPVQVALRKYLPNIGKGLQRALNPEEAKYFNWLKNPKVSATPEELSGVKVYAPQESLPYQFIPAENVVNKTFYHGTGKKLTDISQARPDIYGKYGLYGEGLYLTDNPVVAKSYAAARNGGNVLSGKIGKANLIDLEKELPDDVYLLFKKAIEGYGGDLPKNKIGKNVWEALNKASRDAEDWGGTVETYQFLSEDLSSMGYDGFKHIGGEVVGGLGKHNVVVVFPQKISSVVSPAMEEALGLTVKQPINPIQKITQALKEAKPIRSQQEALYSAERSKRAGQIIEAGQRVPGEQGYFAQLKALKGQLPKVQYEGIRGKLSQGDIDGVFNIVEQNQVLSPYEKISAKTGLVKLLGAEGGAVPTEGEIKLLSQVFPPDFIQEVLSKRPVMQKLFEGVEEVLNVPRAIMASADMSAPLRQGLFLIGRPKQWLPAFRDMFKYAFNEKAYQGLLEDIQKRPTFQLMKEGGLSITDIGKALSSREEKFMSNLAERIPVLGHIVRGSNRAYSGFLNKLRADTFDDIVNSAQKLGLKPEGKLLKDIGNFVSTATGRGKLPGALERSAVVLNSVLFSPRLMFSRINLLNPGYYVGLDPFVRKEALKSLLTLTGTATSIITLAKIGGADIGTDPRSADFGKIKYGNTRYDILGGFQQYIRLASQLISGEHISSTTGVKTTLGEGYKPLTRADILGRFLETKEAPVVTFALGLMKGKDNFGKDFNVPQEVAQRFVPMVAQDMADLVKERGLSGIAMDIPALFGVGVQTYSPTPTEIVYSTNSVIKHTKELMKEGRDEEAKKLITRNTKLLKMGIELKPLQDELSKFEKAKGYINNNVKLSPEQKKKAISFTDKMIKKYGTKMQERYKAIKND
jgi:hypothetical protein